MAASRLTTFGPNAIAAEKPPSAWVVAASQLRDPMNIMLVAVVVVSLVIGRGVDRRHRRVCSSLLNLGLGTRQELTARASVDALAKMQTPQARVVRDGAVSLVPATEIVPGTSCTSRQATSSRRTDASSGPPPSRPRRLR